MNRSGEFGGIWNQRVPSPPGYAGRYPARQVMIVTDLARDDTTEPFWDSVGIHGCDFRPRLDGDLLNLFTTTYPLESKSDTASLSKDIAVGLAN